MGEEESLFTLKSESMGSAFSDKCRFAVIFCLLVGIKEIHGGWQGSINSVSGITKDRNRIL